MKNNFEYTDSDLDWTENFEGCRLSAYQDQVGVWTIGVGHTHGVHQGDTCTQDQAMQWMREDIQSVVDAINRDLAIEITQPEFSALVDFAFNLGISALEHSTLWRLLNAGDFAGARAQFPLWDHAGGKVVAGLLKRRLAEQAIFK